MMFNVIVTLKLYYTQWCVMQLFHDTSIRDKQQFALMLLWCFGVLDDNMHSKVCDLLPLLVDPLNISHKLFREQFFYKVGILLEKRLHVGARRLTLAPFSRVLPSLHSLCLLLPLPTLGLLKLYFVTIGWLLFVKGQGGACIIQQYDQGRIKIWT